MNPAQILFIDIETVSNKAKYEDLEDHWKALWTHKSKYLTSQSPDKTVEDLYRDKAAIFAEFGKICCITVGGLKESDFRLKSFTGLDEKDLLVSFSNFLNDYYKDPKKMAICGHNIKEFDIPYICRRMLIHNIKLPAIFQIHGKKPWELDHILDTLDLWKFGDYKHYTSLEVLAACFGFESSKSDISGKDVGDVFWKQEDIERIAEYCGKDVVLTAKVFFKMMAHHDIDIQNIISS